MEPTKVGGNIASPWSCRQFRRPTKPELRFLRRFSRRSASPLDVASVNKIQINSILFDLEVNQTYIKAGCQSGRKVVTHDSKSDLPLVRSSIRT